MRSLVPVPVRALSLAAILIGFVASGEPTSSQESAFRGYTTSETVAQRQWEERYRAVPDAANLREYMRVIAAEPHHAGGPGSKKVADYVLEKFTSWGLNAWIEEQEALMPFPTERIVEMVAPERYRARLEEPTIPEDPDSGDDGLPVYNAYSADGDVTGDLVYVNYGTPEDYDALDELGIDVAGKIVIARYGRSWRGIKPKMAAERGAIGCIIYSDPEDDGYYQGDTYPVGPYRPPLGAQRGSVMDMPRYPGDPLTPGWGSERGGRKLDMAEATTLVTIPVLPMSYGDAEPLLRQLGGPVAPEDFRGALGLTYHIGPGPARVRIKLAFDWQVRPLYNVIARIDGAEFPDQWIVHGNHHDAWVNGADDPTSGNVALMETARGLAEMVKQGWSPKRTIVIASWDGEEWGLLGSTEWAEKHADELLEKGVVYINSDATSNGWLSAGGSHSLQAFVSEVARDVPGPRGGDSVFAEARERRLDQASSDEARAAIESHADLSISALGSGSDYTVFLDHLTMASLNLGFGGEQSDGFYHSKYDSFESYTKFADTEFNHGRALSQTIGSIMMRLADATVLPFQFTDYERTLRTYVSEIEAVHDGMDGAPALDLAPVRAALDELGGAARAYERVLARLGARAVDLPAERRDELAALNRILYQSERAFRHEGGLPKREWFKHLVYAPGFYTGYGVKTLPGIREGVEEEAWDDADRYVPIVAAAIERLGRQVDEATLLLARVVE